MKKYVVITDIDNEELASFDTRKEAQKFIKEAKEFDKREGNPFDETYHIEIEDDAD